MLTPIGYSYNHAKMLLRHYIREGRPSDMQVPAEGWLMQMDIDTRLDCLYDGMKETLDKDLGSAARDA